METTTRRSTNLQGSIWDDDYVQSITTPYMAKECIEQADDLKRQLKAIIEGTDGRLDQLELIDNLQRLDISHHFCDELRRLLDSIYTTGKRDAGDLFFESLRFRLLRQNGYRVPQDVFDGFLDETGDFEASLAGDVKGILALYEASFLSMEGETVLDLAKDFSGQHLKAMVDEVGDGQVIEQIRHALEGPLQWRVQKLEAKWFIHMYASRSDANPVLLRLAKLDFNMTQAKYQQEIKYLSRWYKETGLPEKLPFVRHRLAECFLWTMGFIPEPQLGYSRKHVCKMGVLITIIDDIYDVYGTPDEIEAFTATIKRWDINALDLLPDYMRICFLVLFNTANEMAYEIMRDQGLNVISNIRKSWVELSRAYDLEARWYHGGHFPSMKEYLNMAWISVAGPLLFLHAYLTTADPINMNELRKLEQHPGIIHWPSMVLRLMDDLGTASGEMERGDVPKSIQCYMRETGCCEDEAREYVKLLIDGALKRMNEETVMRKDEGVVGVIKERCLDLTRIALCYYQFGDGFGHPQCETKKNLVSLVVQPIPMP